MRAIEVKARWRLARREHEALAWHRGIEGTAAATHAGGESWPCRDRL